MKKINQNILIPFLIILSINASAINTDSRMDQSNNLISSEKIPIRGMTSIIVKEKHGIPKSSSKPVGNPPITKWEYEKFVVFFEYNLVLHSVIKR